MPIIRTAVMLSIALLILIPRPSTAQGNSEKDDDKSCDKAAKIVRKGHPEKKEMWALDQLVACGSAGARSLVAGMPQYATDTDTLVLDSFFSVADNWRDGAIMNAALSLAGNPNASVQARVFAVRHLVTLVDVNVKFLYGDISATPPVTVSAVDSLTLYSRPCLAAHGDHAPGNSATPLPANYVAVIKAAMATISSASGTPAPVRNAAACAQW
jgi:hypothetical protein